jgi:aspartate-semialdehyde dehydrogenase
MAGFRVAVAGATGLVGRTILSVLEERHFPVERISLLASERSAGSVLPFRGDDLVVTTLGDDSFADCDIAYFSAGAAVSRRYAPVAAQYARFVVDNSSAFRGVEDIPLVVPEVNAHVLAGYEGVIANPNCSTIQMVVALQPLHAAFGLQSVVVSTYQSVSGSGEKGVRALDGEMSTGERPTDSPYPHSIAYNALPHIDVFDETGWSGEERKMIAETRKIMGLPSLHVVPTTVRVPVRVGHSESVYARFDAPVSAEAARRVLERAPGVIVRDDPAANIYPLAIEVEGRDEVFVGRIRRDPEDAHALLLWVVGDNLRKGAATNAVQVGEVALALPRQRVPQHA